MLKVVLCLVNRKKKRITTPGIQDYLLSIAYYYYKTTSGLLMGNYMLQSVIMSFGNNWNEYFRSHMFL
jgi:hypothetical protein